MGLHILFLSFNSLLRIKCIIVSCLVVLCQTVRNKDLFNDSPLLQLIADNPYDVLNSVPKGSTCVHLLSVTSHKEKHGSDFLHHSWTTGSTS